MIGIIIICYVCLVQLQKHWSFRSITVWPQVNGTKGTNNYTSSGVCYCSSLHNLIFSVHYLQCSCQHILYYCRLILIYLVPVKMLMVCRGFQKKTLINMTVLRAGTDPFTCAFREIQSSSIR